MGKPDPAVAPPPKKVPLIVQVFDGFEQPLKDCEVEVVNLNDIKKNTDDRGFARFGLVDPRIRWDIKVRKSDFGPPATPFVPGERRLVTRVNTRGTPIQTKLTRSSALLTVQVVKNTGGNLEGVNVTVDGIGGAQKTKADGTAGPFVVLPGLARAHAQKDGCGPPGTLPGGFNKEVVGTRPMLDGEIATITLTLEESPFVTPRIDKPTLTLVMKKAHTKPKRQEIKLSIDVDFDGKGDVTVTRAGDGNITAFDQLTAGSVVALPKEFTGAQLKTVQSLFLEGLAGSSKLDDIEVTLTLKEGTKQKRDPAKLKITVVEVTLDICKSRTSAKTDPDPLSEADKIGVGRFVHRQIGDKHGRAMLIVRKTKPDTFAGTLTLAPTTASGSGTVVLFNAASEIASGQAALGNPHEFPSPKADIKFFVEGNTTSGALRDVGYRLGVKGVEDDGDHVQLTVVQFSKLKISVPTTDPNTIRFSNDIAPPGTQDFTRAPATPVAADFDEDFDLAPLIVLIEGSVTNLEPLELSVLVAPANVPVRWSARRDTRPKPIGDSPDILKLKPAPNAAPTIKAKANPLEAQMLADSVGSFHVCPYVDCNGNSQQDFNDPSSGVRIDREPFILLNVVLVRAQAFQNDSVAQQKAIFTPFAPTSATGVQFQSGLFTGAGAAAVHMNAVITLIGGGPEGKLGLDHVFAGWINNVTSIDGVGEYVVPASGATPAVTHRESMRFHGNSIATGTPPRPLFFIPSPPPPLTAAVVTTTAAPVDTPFPILDTSPFGSEGTGGNTAVGTDGAQGGVIPVAPVAGAPLGLRRRVQMFDSPSNGASISHLVFPGVLSLFRFNVDFQCDLCLWTNKASVPTPTVDPACLLYVSVLTNRWRIRCLVTFNAAAGGAGTIVTAPKDIATMTPEKLKPDEVRLAKPITKPGMDVRFPIVLRIFGIDART